jgi:hypothetical protein
MFSNLFKNLQLLLSLLAAIAAIFWLSAQLSNSTWSIVVIVIFVAAGFFVARWGRGN